MSGHSGSPSTPRDERILLRVDSPEGAAAGAAVTWDPAGFLRVRVFGPLTLALAERVQRTVARAYPGVDRLLDLREADLGMWDTAAIRTFYARLADAPSRTLPSRAAAVVARDLDYGIARMFEALTPPHHPVTYRVFRGEAEAIAWLSARSPADEGPTP